jgi:sec-independent protein translocase protein TatB
MFPENRLLELLIIGAVALIVVGPKDLPILLRRVGQWMGRMRAMAAEFRASFDELARQSELDELRKEVEAMRSDPRHYSNFDPMAQSALSAASAEAGFTPPEVAAPAPAPVAVTETAPAQPAPATAKAAKATTTKPRRPRAKKTPGVG